MVIFHSYVSLPEGTPQKWPFHLVCECEPLPNPSKMARKKGTLSLLKKNTAFRWVFPKNPMVGTNTTISDFREKGMISAGETPWSALYASWQWMANWKWPCPLTSVLPNHMQISRVFLPWMSIQSCMCTYNEICHMCVCAQIYDYICIYTLYIYVI